MRTNNECFNNKIGCIRQWEKSLQRYGPWKDLIHPSNSSEPFEIVLNRGGVIRFYRNLLKNDEGKRTKVANAMSSCDLYRQYEFRHCYPEPRVQVLLADVSSTGKHVPGYAYHGIQMRAQPLTQVPEVLQLAEEYANKLDIPGKIWNIGVVLVVYRNGQDSIGWHADDTQGESVILCIVVESKDLRSVLFRPKKSKVQALNDGDEEIRLHVKEGDGYEMDAKTQEGYEHAMLKHNTQHRRMALIFRQGIDAHISRDSGVALKEKTLLHSSPESIDILAPKQANPKVSFGHNAQVVEGTSLYSRKNLFETRAQTAYQKGVSGNSNDGCDSIVVSRQSDRLREHDELSWLRYTSSRRQGGGAFFVNFKEQIPVRVFRSSKLAGKFAPPLIADTGQTGYRYDGLYMVTRMWGVDGLVTTSSPPPGGPEHTFLLKRCQTKSESERELVSPSAYHNKLSVAELWEEIQRSRGISPPSPFKCICVQDAPLANISAVHDNIESDAKTKTTGASLTKTITSVVTPINIETRKPTHVSPFVRGGTTVPISARKRKRGRCNKAAIVPSGPAYKSCITNDVATPGEQVAANVTASNKNGSWILAYVVNFNSDSKSYYVRDAYHPTEFMTVPLNLVMRLTGGTNNHILKGSHVLALFPDTSVFYFATVSQKTVQNTGPNFSSPVSEKQLVQHKEDNSRKEKRSIENVFSQCVAVLFDEDDDEKGTLPEKNILSQHVILLKENYLNEYIRLSVRTTLQCIVSDVVERKKTSLIDKVLVDIGDKPYTNEIKHNDGKNKIVPRTKEKRFFFKPPRAGRTCRKEKYNYISPASPHCKPLCHSKRLRHSSCSNIKPICCAEDQPSKRETRYQLRSTTKRKRSDEHTSLLGVIAETVKSK